HAARARSLCAATAAWALPGRRPRVAGSSESMTSSVTSQHARRVLVVGLPEGDDDPALPVLRRQFELSVAQTSEEAVRLLGESEFDLVVTSPAALAPLSRSIGMSETERVLRHVAQAA